MYYVAATVPEGDEREDTMEAMWRSVDNHVHDVHEHDSPLFHSVIMFIFHMTGKRNGSH
jgi:hypothetical protein